MQDIIDLNAGSGFVYRRAAADPAASQLNVLIDAALVAADRVKPGLSRRQPHRRVALRKLVYEVTGTPKDDGHEFNGSTLRIFEAGHLFENLQGRLAAGAGFDVRTRNRAGEQFGLIAGGRIRGHIDGAIVDGPDIDPLAGALGTRGARREVVVRRCQPRRQAARPVYFAQVQLYMAYMQLPVALFTATNRPAGALSRDRAVRPCRGAGAVRQGGGDHPSGRGWRAAAADR